MEEGIIRQYGDKLRIRVCGVCWQKDRLLLVNHGGLTPGDFWALPGGGVDFGSPVSENLERELLEETGLKVSVGQFQFGCEFIRRPLHSIELFFRVEVTGGVLTVGTDPELQIIKDVRFFGFEEIRSLPGEFIHGIFRFATSSEEFRNLNGFYRI